jgi:ParB family chromosome partitioning protein
MAIKRGLGKGFEALIPTETIEEEFDVTASTDREVSDLRQIKLDKISRDASQPRKKFDETALAELAKSIKEYGVLQPIVVIPNGGKYQIVAGERRWRASKLAGLTTIPALVRTLNGQRKLEVALIENVQREDLNPLEFATALAKMRNQFNMELKEIGDKLGKSLTVVSNHLRLFQLPDFAKKAIEDGKMSEGFARQVLALESDVDAQRTLTNHLLNDGWSVRKAEQFVMAYRAGGRTSTRKATKAAQQENDFTRSLSGLIGLPVKQKLLGRGAGEVIISYKKADELDKIKKALNLL